METYEALKMEIIEFEEQDIIMESSDGDSNPETIFQSESI